MKNFRLRSLGAIALSLSLCGGIVSLTHAATSTKPTTKPAPPKGGPLDSILSKLKLSTDQKAAIKVIVDAANADIKALNEDTTLTDAEKLTAHKAICDAAFAKIGALLTADQKTLFDAWLAAQPAPKAEKPKGDKPTKPSGDKPGGDDCKNKPKGDKPTKPTTPTTPTATPTVPTATPTPSGGDSSNDA